MLSYAPIKTGTTHMHEIQMTDRVYPDINVQRPAEYWDYENLTINWG